jgi:hypothetical protein
MPTTRLTLLLVVVLAAVASATCDSVPLTAPGGSTIFAQANPSFVIANGGTAVVTALVTEPAGTLVPNGTEVFFFTNLGRIDDRVKTKDGLAVANFVSDARSGTASITVWSGGAAPSVAASASPSPGTGTGTGTATATGTGSATVAITVGSANPKTVVVTADPTVLAGSRQAIVRAYVYDGNGNPVQNVPVIFSVSVPTGTTAPLQETLDSGGTPVYTDSNGQATDVLRTRAPNGTTQKSITVTATVPVGAGANGAVLSASIVVAVNYTP